MIKDIIIPKEVEFLLNEIKDSRVRKRLIKVYEALLFKRADSKDFFDVPSSYLKKVNVRYYKAIDLLIEYGIIEYKKNEYEPYHRYNDTSLFENKITKSYSVNGNKCMQYRFLINVDEGSVEKFEIDVDNLYKNKRWYNLTKKSLLELGLEPRIGRDNFSRRLHTNVTGTLGLKIEDGGIINSYKDYCKGYYSVDGVTSQPRLLWLHLKEIGLYDKNLNYVFENDLDFYEYVGSKIELLGETIEEKRSSAKDLFASWINGKGYLEGVQCDIRTIFPVANTYITNYKSDSYKNFCKLLQYKESKIWIDDLLENCPTDFALSVHDSLIIKKKDIDTVLEYCKNKYPQLKFKKELI